jgi:hypothetical protein
MHNMFGIMLTITDLINLQGIEPGRALYDALPEGSEPRVLKRANRSRTPSEKGADYSKYFTLCVM